MTTAADRYTSSAIGHPDAQRLGTWQGWLYMQDAETEDAVQKALDDGDASDIAGAIELTMDDSCVIRGNTSVTHIGLLDGGSDGVLMVISQWDADTFCWAVLNIDPDGRITASVHVNPREPNQSWREDNPMLIISEA